ncbi:MAG: AAA family ATPase [Pseudonocardiales bacterium]
MTRTRVARAAGGFVRQVRLDPDADTGRYPFTLPVVQQLSRAGGLDVDGPVTFLVGDNGTGKSTLIEALAVAAGFNAEGGSQSFRFATRATESSLGDHLVLRWGASRAPGSSCARRVSTTWPLRSSGSTPTRTHHRCCLPTAGSLRTSAHTASPSWIW